MARAPFEQNRVELVAVKNHLDHTVDLCWSQRDDPLHRHRLWGSAPWEGLAGCGSDAVLL
jgi:hypothetical protein